MIALLWFFLTVFAFAVQVEEPTCEQLAMDTGAPHRGLSALIRRISARRSAFIRAPQR
jgi:hypothetical protein